MSTEDTPIIDQLIMKNFGKVSKTVRSSAIVPQSQCSVFVNDAIYPWCHGGRHVFLASLRSVLHINRAANYEGGSNRLTGMEREIAVVLVLMSFMKVTN